MYRQTMVFPIVTYGSEDPYYMNSRKASTSVSLPTLTPVTVWTMTNWRTLKEMGIPDHLILLLRTLHAGQEATVRTSDETGLVQD